MLAGTEHLDSYFLSACNYLKNKTPEGDIPPGT